MQNYTNPNQTVLITGATKGIGKAIAHKLAAERYNLILVSSSEANLNAMKKDLISQNSSLVIDFFPVDLRDENEIKRLANWASSKKIDILVNNVGLFEPFSILGEEEGLIQRLLTVNYLCAHLLCQAIGKNMKALRSGHIFNISSTAFMNPVKAGSYTVTKFAMHGLTLVLREELREFGVKVTEIIPGSTQTSSWELTEYAKNCFVDPKDIANAVFNCLQIGENAMIEEIVIKPQKGNILTDPIE